jgi:hypothetical protein
LTVHGIKNTEYALNVVKEMALTVVCCASYAERKTSRKISCTSQTLFAEVSITKRRAKEKSASIMNGKLPEYVLAAEKTVKKKGCFVVHAGVNVKDEGKRKKQTD